MRPNSFIILFAILFNLIANAQAQVVVNSLAAFRTAVLESNKTIKLTPGNYNLTDLPSGSRVINCSGSNNTIDLTGVRIRTLVGSINEVYFIVSGDNNVVRNGAIEDYYQSGLQEVTDFSAFNNDRNNLAYGLKGAPVMSLTGNGNKVVGLEMTIRGSFPYGYGSQYGIGSTNTFGLNKRCGILITGSEGGGVGNTLDSITMYHHAFGHGIFMQEGATQTTLKNCYVEGRMRLSADMYKDTKTYDLPYQTNYKFPTGSGSWRLPFAESYDIPYDVMYPLSEDGIRSYSNTGSVTVENCTVKQMRGGIRLYLASSATVTNSKAIDCGETNYNMPSGGTITGSSGNFSFAPLNDNRLARSNQKIELTILPSPNATGPHNIMDLEGNNHVITLHRTPGPKDLTTRAIVITGDNSTIINETEYPIILETGASGNKITSCGPVTNNGTNNTVTLSTNCVFEPICTKTTAKTEAECHDDMLGIQSEACSEGGQNIGYINDGDWAKYSGVNLSTMKSITARVASKSSGTIEVRLGSISGTLIGTIPVSSTGGNQNWVSNSANITATTGVHDVYLVFKGGSGYLFNINWFGFSKDVVIITDVAETMYRTLSIYPNPTATSCTINGWTEGLTWQMYNNYATEVMAGNTKEINTTNLKPGSYFITFSNGKTTQLIKTN